MSYILDALRKSEQQRQAAQPDNVTERLLVNPPQTNNKPVKWLALLSTVNILALAFSAWFFLLKPANEIQQKISVSIAQNPPQPEKTEAVTAQAIQNSVNNQARQLNRQQPAEPNIAQMIQQKNDDLTQSEIKKITQQETGKKPIPGKKDNVKPKALPPKAKFEAPKTASTPSVALPSPRSTPHLQELTNEYRNNLPNLTINVFSYAEQPEDRFVIIDMVKYKTGQLIKGAVKLKEIRPDSIVLQYGNDTFKVERP